MGDLGKLKTQYISDGNYGVWIELLNIIDIQIYEFIKMGIDISIQIDYFDNFRRSYIKNLAYPKWSL